MTTTLGFPVNLVDAVATAFKAVPGVDITVQRRLRPTDPKNTMAVFAVNWQPGMWEIGGQNNMDPTFSTYNLEVHFVYRIMGGTEGGTEAVAAMAKIIRTMLYRDAPTGVALRACSETIDGSTETVSRWKVQEQKFFDAPMSKSEFVFLCTTKFWVETQTVSG